MDPITPEQKRQRAIERRRANFKAYYERHKEEMRERARQNYDPEQKRAYYEENKDHIRQVSANYYKKKRSIGFAQRLDAIISKCESEPAFAAVFERIKLVASSLTEKELQLFESLVEIKKETVNNPTENGKNSL